MTERVKDGPEWQKAVNDTCAAVEVALERLTELGILDQTSDMPAEGGLLLEMVRPRAMPGIVAPKVGNARCFDTGAIQGRMIRASDSPPYKEKKITIQTGNSDITSNSRQMPK